MIAIISCTKSKFKLYGVEARKLYWKSNLFRLSYRVIKKLYPAVQVYILSAKYGLIKDTAAIGYYNETLLNKSNKELKEFSNKIKLKDDYIFIGGKIYKQVLQKEPKIEIGKGLPIGKKLQFLKKILSK